MNSKSATQWLAAITTCDAALLRALAPIYGASSAVLARLPLLQRVVSAFLDRFGDHDVRIIRCPGRINLRGMHVDTHGGYLNLMTHQRETVVVFTSSKDPTSTVVNIETGFPEVRCDPAQWNAAKRTAWADFIAQAEVRNRVNAKRGDWSNYVEGAILRARHQWPAHLLGGIRAVAGSDIPRGASLSSSTALSLAVFMSVAASNGQAATPTELITIAQDIEWITGARVGVSDQVAMLFPRANEVFNFAPPFDLSKARKQPFPDGLRLLVINSHTERNLSGADQLRYTRNRFAYSIALELLRSEMLRGGVAEPIVRSMLRLSDFNADALEPFGGNSAVYHWLQQIPESISLDELRARYNIRALDETYGTYFGPLPECDRPDQFNFRGPLLYGLAESERARVFIDAIATANFTKAGRLMTIGHDGDRIVDASGNPWSYPVDNNAVQELSRRNVPIHQVPGAYGASSRALDALVDCSIGAGALGASLTGAGIAGVVLALCRAPDTERIVDAIHSYMETVGSGRLARRPAPLTPDELRSSVVVNQPPASACELDPL
ncbi:MAG: galactokinase family protein [Candidatus Hydrogenedentes bacterium]|nr:galactokinase family protein [Candidatus Hydrogenedentota bacterium]